MSKIKFKAAGVLSQKYNKPMFLVSRCLFYNQKWTLLSFVQWTVGGTKGKKKVKPGKGSEKKNATKKKVNKATASGSSDGDSSAESSAPEEGTSSVFVGGVLYKQFVVQ